MANTIDIILSLKDKASSGLGKVVSGLKNVVGIAAGATAAAAGVGLTLAAGAVKAVSSFAKLESTINGLSNQLGLSREEAEKLGPAVEEAYREGFGSIGEASDAVADAFRRFGDVGTEALTDISTRARELSQAFGGDVSEKMAAVDTLMKNFGISSAEAFDLVTKGYQDGLNQSGDFAESITEYATQFSSGGASAEQFFSVMKSGLQDGILGTDKAADAFKEFRVRIQDGSAATRQGLQSIGIDADDMARKLSSGSMTAADAFQQVISKLRDTKDSSSQMQAGVALLGTQFEDLGTKSALALDLTAMKMDEAKGASDRLKQGQDGLTLSWTQLTNSLDILQAKFGEVFSSGAASSVSFLAENVDALIEKVRQLKEDGTLDVWAANINAVVTQTIEVFKSFWSIAKSIFDGFPVSSQTVIKAVSAISAGIEKLPLYFQYSFAKIDMVYSQMKQGALEVAEVWYAVSGQFDKAFDSKKQVEAEEQRREAIRETIGTIEDEKAAIDERKEMVLEASLQAVEAKKAEVAGHKKVEEEKTAETKKGAAARTESARKAAKEQTAVNAEEAKKQAKDAKEAAKAQEQAAKEAAKAQTDAYKKATDDIKADLDIREAEYEKNIAEIERLEAEGVISHEDAQAQKVAAEKEFLEYKIQQTELAVDAAISQFGRESEEFKKAKADQMAAQKELVEFTTDSMKKIEQATESAMNAGRSSSSSSRSSSRSGSSGSSGGSSVLSRDQAMNKTISELRSNSVMENAAETLGVISKYNQMIKSIRELGGNTSAAKNLTLNQIENYVASLLSQSAAKGGGSSSSQNMGTLNIQLPSGSGEVQGDPEFLKQMQEMFNDYARAQ